MLSWPCVRCSPPNLCLTCPKRVPANASQTLVESVHAAQVTLACFSRTLANGDLEACARNLVLVADFLALASEELKKLSEARRIEKLTKG